MRSAIMRCGGVGGDAGGETGGGALATSVIGVVARERITQRRLLIIGGVGCGVPDGVVVTGAGSVCVESNVDQ